MSILATLSFAPCSEAISSSTGATILHGPHQVAQKSTSTGLPRNCSKANTAPFESGRVCRKKSATVSSATRRASLR